MAMSALRARVLAFVAVFLVVLPLGATSGAQYWCRSMGRLMNACCCPARTAATDRGTSGAQLKAEDCCKRIERATGGGVPAVREGAPRVLDAVLVATAPAVSFAVPQPGLLVLVREPVQARAPPRAGPPLFLKNCSLLT
jgi:hypothetical protein